jgi:hypothetical protein
MKAQIKTSITFLALLFSISLFAQNSPIKIEGNFTSGKETREFDKIIGELNGNYVAVEEMNPKKVSFQISRHLAIRLINKKTLKPVKEKFYDDVLLYTTKEGNEKYIYHGAWMSGSVIRFLLQEVSSGKVNLHKVNASTLEISPKGEFIFQLDKSYEPQPPKRGETFISRKRSSVHLSSISPNGSKAYITCSYYGDSIITRMGRQFSIPTLDKTQRFFYEVDKGVNETANAKFRYSFSYWIDNDKRILVKLPNGSNKGVIKVVKDEEEIEKYSISINGEELASETKFGLVSTQLSNGKIALASLNTEANGVLTGVIDLENLKDEGFNYTSITNEMIASFRAKDEKDVSKQLKNIEKGKIASIRKSIYTNISGVSLSDNGDIYLSINSQDRDMKFSSYDPNRPNASTNSEEELFDQNMLVLKINDKGQLAWFKNLWYKTAILSEKTFPYLNSAPLLKGNQVHFLVNADVKKIEGIGLEYKKSGNSDCTLISISDDGKTWTKTNLNVPNSIETCNIKTQYPYMDGEAMIVPVKPYNSQVGYAKITIE